MRYLVVIEAGEAGFSAYSPDLPGCIAAGRTRREVEEQMRRAQFEAVERWPPTRWHGPLASFIDPVGNRRNALAFAVIGA